ncbi:MAG: HAD family hydrolase [Candidatus Dormibacteria bacterium]
MSRVRAMEQRWEQPVVDRTRGGAHLVLRTTDALGTEPDRAALLGDSISDIQAARAARAGSIGLANKPGKRARLSGAGAGAVIDTMEQLAGALG